MDANGSSLSVAQGLTPKASPFRTPSHGARAGFLLLDSSLRPLSFNTEAIRVLGYPDTPANVRRPDVFLAGKIRSRLMSESASRESPLVTEFRSGGRRYSCRAFLVDAHANGSSHARIAVLLERSPSGLIPLSYVAQQFHLTRRERDALEHLLQGLSSKEIASRMSVSPNTVKAFLRLIMIKMGVSSRSAIAAKAVTTQP
jgi:DNA-binding CsgD family transcriptional regulator